MKYCDRNYNISFYEADTKCMRNMIFIPVCLSYYFIEAEYTTSQPHPKWKANEVNSLHHEHHEEANQENERPKLSPKFKIPNITILREGINQSRNQNYRSFAEIEIDDLTLKGSAHNY